MKDDPASIKLREDHREWMKLNADAQETAERFEMIAAVHPSYFLRLLSRFSRWVAGIAIEREEIARTEARATYEEPKQ